MGGYYPPEKRRQKSRRGTTNRNVRGNTRDRAARRRYLLRVYEADITGHCRCYRCGALLCEVNITVDRIVPGAQGGKYVRTNIRPACGVCNSATGAKLAQTRRV